MLSSRIKATTSPNGQSDLTWTTGAVMMSLTSFVVILPPRSDVALSAINTGPCVPEARLPPLGCLGRDLWQGPPQKLFGARVQGPELQREAGLGLPNDFCWNLDRPSPREISSG